jgi:hypothetical protein
MPPPELVMQKNQMATYWGCKRCTSDGCGSRTPLPMDRNRDVRGRRRDRDTAQEGARSVWQRSRRKPGGATAYGGSCLPLRLSSRRIARGEIEHMIFFAMKEDLELPGTFEHSLPVRVPHVFLTANNVSFFELQRLHVGSHSEQVHQSVF